MDDILILAASRWQLRPADCAWHCQYGRDGQPRLKDFLAAFGQHYIPSQSVNPLIVLSYLALVQSMAALQKDRWKTTNGHL